MRLALLTLASLLLLVPLPAAAPAQGLGNVLGPVVGPVDSLLRRGARRVLRPFSYRPRIRTQRSPTASRSRTASQSSQRAAGEAAEFKPFWPEASQDLFDFILLSEGAGLWTHGQGAIVASAFAQPSGMRDKRDSRRVAASDNAEQTIGAAFASEGEMVCAERDASRATEEAEKELRRKLVPANGQQNALAELGAALRRTEQEMVAGCPYGMPDTMPERLRTVQDRFWAMRVAVTSLRKPLQKFYDTLTSEQKASLDRQQPSTRESKREDLANQCHVAGQFAPQWPADEIASAVRPSKDQQAGFVSLNEVSTKMGMLVTGSCSQKVPVTPLARLDATLDWLDALLFAGVNTSVEVESFYRSLSDEQKKKLNGLDL